MIGFRPPKCEIRSHPERHWHDQEEGDRWNGALIERGDAERGKQELNQIVRRVDEDGELDDAALPDKETHSKGEHG